MLKWIAVIAGAGVVLTGVAFLVWGRSPISLTLLALTAVAILAQVVLLVLDLRRELAKRAEAQSGS